MFHHMVMFRFDDEATAAEAITKIRGLGDSIAEVEELVVGRDELRSPRSYDVGMLMTFTDDAAYERYQTHPEHVPIARWIDGASTGAVAVDWTD